MDAPGELVYLPAAVPIQGNMIHITILPIMARSILNIMEFITNTTMEAILIMTIG